MYCSLLVRIVAVMIIRWSLVLFICNFIRS